MGLALLTGAAARADQVDDQFNQLFGDQMKLVQGTRITTDDVELAARMVDAAGKLKDTPKLRQRLLSEGYDLALRDPAGYPTASGAAAAMIDALPAERAAWEDKLIEVYNQDWRGAARADRDGKQQALVDRLVSVAGARDERGDYAGSLPLYRQALGVLPRGGAGRDAITERQRQATYKMQLQAKADGLVDRLKAEPTNADIARQLVELYVVGFDQPGKAEQYAKATGDENLQRLVPLAAAPLDKIHPDRAYDLAEWYDGLSAAADANAKTAMLQRTRGFYQHFTASTKEQGIRAVKARLKIEEIDRALAAAAPEGENTSSGPAVVGDTTDLLKLVDPEKDKVDGAWMLKNGILGNLSEDYGDELRFPVKVDGDYELTVRFRTDKLIRSYAYVYLYLPIQGDRMTYFRVANDYYPPRIGLSANIRTLATQISPGAWHTITVRKETAKDGTIKVGVAMDGRNILGWQGSPLAAQDDYDAPQRPGIAFNYARAVVSKCTIKRLSGTITPVDRNAKEEPRSHRIIIRRHVVP